MQVGGFKPGAYRGAEEFDPTNNMTCVVFTSGLRKKTIIY
jgi:hypothetical protein